MSLSLLLTISAIFGVNCSTAADISAFISIGSDVDAVISYVISAVGVIVGDMYVGIILTAAVDLLLDGKLETISSVV
jgi:hypothetical protein